ncbi:GntR family transcriptional regulator [Alkalihalobacillus sp. LMS39]|uniref:GntR family transcriptional regulator n=1 Tax=Alkalihalobacillus sp. LMS39 TaxID=2924032 RepID=UPI001FB3FD8F|nr:GntR family transcriptional regulator [Alkalihalobacillus sp. LMS39]UOE95370.1 GntR family transcriptional regulator [Alkalihalobacillus sp. LMS39]
MFELDNRSRSPIYEQIIEKIKNLIMNQVLQPDEKLPSVRMLSNQITVNPNTIQKAYRELERQGYLYSVIGKGYFVVSIDIMPNEDKRNEVEAELFKLLTEAVFLGLTKDELLQLYTKAKKVTEGGESS